MTTSPETLLPGFADPVDQSQAAFRSILDAMARPGTLQAIVGPTEHPVGISAAAASVLLTLVDYTTPIWLDPSIEGEEAVGAYLRFHTGAALVDDPARAAFALLGVGSRAEFADFSIGTPEYPDRSTTLILDVDNFDTGDAVTLRGPGIETTASLTVSGIPAKFWDAIKENAVLFPLGLDAILTAGDTVVSVPRSTRLEG